MQASFALCALCLLAGHAAATDLVYQPVNPNFGGYPANGANLLAGANATNRHSESMEIGRASCRERVL